MHHPCQVLIRYMHHSYKATEAMSRQTINSAWFSAAKSPKNLPYTCWADRQSRRKIRPADNSARPSYTDFLNVFTEPQLPRHKWPRNLNCRVLRVRHLIVHGWIELINQIWLDDPSARPAALAVYARALS